MKPPRFRCTKETPYQPGMKGPIEHDSVREISSRDGYPGGDIVTKQCSNCGHIWDEELPQ